MRPVIAIVGRPNVGKSSYLNAVCRRRISIVEPTPGVTRDRVVVPLEYDGHSIELMDTGGIGVVDEHRLDEHIERQIDAALERADVIIFLVDGKDGVSALDEKVASVLRRLGKPVLLGVNKIDHPNQEALAYEFYSLGLGDPHLLSAKEAMGVFDLLDRAIASAIRGATEEEEATEASGDAAEVEVSDDAVASDDVADYDDDDPESNTPHGDDDGVVKIAFVGKRNVGKSTMLNRLAREERVIVSDIPGTTRDAVDVDIEYAGRSFRAIDTAGIMRKSSIANSIEFYSQARSEAAIRRSDVVLFLLDASQDISRVDKIIGAQVVDEGKPCIVVVNKWDLASEKMLTGEYETYFADHVSGLHFAPIVFASAKDGLNLDGMLDVAFDLRLQAQRRVGTGELNRVVSEAHDRRKPGGPKGYKSRIFYGTQIRATPPTFTLFVNDPKLFPPNYRRYLENRLREAFDFSEVPVRVFFNRRKSLYHD